MSNEMYVGGKGGGFWGTTQRFISNSSVVSQVNIAIQ